MSFDAFLKIDGHDGESQDSKHKNEIEVLSYSFGGQQPASSGVGGGSGVGRVNIDDLAIVKHVDKSSPLLFVSLATGKHIPKAVLTVRKAGGDQQDFMTVTLSDLIVSSLHNTGQPTGTDGLPTEQMTLNFSKINWEYKEQGADGSLKGTVQGGWDLKAAKKV
jgi:type VI secretion system secreted protein Hcp